MSVSTGWLNYLRFMLGREASPHLPTPGKRHDGMEPVDFG